MHYAGWWDMSLTTSRHRLFLCERTRKCPLAYGVRLSAEGSNEGEYAIVGYSRLWESGTSIIIILLTFHEPSSTEENPGFPARSVEHLCGKDRRSWENVGRLCQADC